MIEPNQITNYNRSINGLQEFLLFGIVVAGKNSKIQAQKLDDFLFLCCQEYKQSHNFLPKDYFDAIRFIGIDSVMKHLVAVRMGQYARISKAFFSLASKNPNLKTITPEQLQTISGIGPKTSRFFCLHTQQNCRCAVLDTHILKHMKTEHPDEYVRDQVPKSTPPTGHNYDWLELQFLKMVDNTNLTVAEYDLMIWKAYAMR